MRGAPCSFRYYPSDTEGIRLVYLLPFDYDHYAKYFALFKIVLCCCRFQGSPLQTINVVVALQTNVRFLVEVVVLVTSSSCGRATLLLVDNFRMHLELVGDT